MSRFLFTMLPANDLGLPTCPDCASTRRLWARRCYRVAEAMRNFGGVEFAADSIEKMTAVTKEAS
jgi:hypothetical protein